MASKVLEGSLMLKEIVGGSRETVLSEETATPMGTCFWVSGSILATVRTATELGT
jgi:hypothetical protein